MYLKRDCDNETVQKVNLYLQLNNLESDEKIPEVLKSRMEPYLFEAGLDPGNNEKKIMTQGLMIYNIINKRRLEIQDICKGTCMDEIFRPLIHI